MKNRYGVTEFLSVKRNFGSGELDRFGGVIVRASDRHTNIMSLSDLKDNPGAAVYMTYCVLSVYLFVGLPQPISSLCCSPVYTIHFSLVISTSLSVLRIITCLYSGL